MTTFDIHDAEDESVTDAIPSVDGPVAAFQPPRRRAPSEDKSDDLQRTAEKRAAEMREAAASAAARLRSSNAQAAPSRLDVESPFLELFDASARTPGAVRKAQPPGPPGFIGPPQPPASNPTPYLDPLDYEDHPQVPPARGDSYADGGLVWQGLPGRRSPIWPWLRGRWPVGRRRLPGGWGLSRRRCPGRQSLSSWWHFGRGA